LVSSRFLRPRLFVPAHAFSRSRRMLSSLV
jgi:hypothetical protein